MADALATLVDGLTFPEGPRWHDGRLWFSDFYSVDTFSRETHVDPDPPHSFQVVATCQYHRLTKVQHSHDLRRTSNPLA